MTISDERLGILSCDEVYPYVGDELTGELSDYSRMGIERHLSHCPSCRLFRKLATGLSHFSRVLSTDEINRSIRNVMEMRGRRDLKKTSKRREPVLFIVCITLGLMAATILVGLAFRPEPPMELSDCEAALPEGIGTGGSFAYCDGTSLLCGIQFRRHDDDFTGPNPSAPTSGCLCLRDSGRQHLLPAEHR